ncbi:MAG: hypothetical protein NVS4B2_11330 [Chloroflexota bacterium]
MTVIDSLVFLGQSIMGPNLTGDSLLAEMGALGIQQAVVCPVKPPDYHLAPENDRVATSAARSEGRLLPLCRVDPNRHDAVAEVNRCCRDLGSRGVFLHPGEELFRINDPRVERIVDVAQQHEKPVIVAAGYPWVSEALQIGSLAARFPRTTFVMTNGGQFNISGLGMTNAWLALETNTNLKVQTTGEYRQDFIERVASDLGADKVLFASGAPLFSQRFELARARQAVMSDEHHHSMLAGNAAGLFT